MYLFSFPIYGSPNYSEYYYLQYCLIFHKGYKSDFSLPLQYPAYIVRMRLPGTFINKYQVLRTSLKSVI